MLTEAQIIGDMSSTITTFQFFNNNTIHINPLHAREQNTTEI